MRSPEVKITSIKFSVNNLLQPQGVEMPPVRSGVLGVIIGIVNSHPLQHLGQAFDAIHGDHHLDLEEFEGKVTPLTFTTADLVPNPLRENCKKNH